MYQEKINSSFFDMLQNICVERERERERDSFPFIKNCETRLIRGRSVKKTFLLGSSLTMKYKIMKVQEEIH